MEKTTLSPDTVTFKRSHFYSVLVVVAFAVGVLVGYLAWGRGSGAAPTAAAGAPTQQAARRFDIPTKGFYSLGPEDAPITIVEFSDYQCPFCEKWHSQVFEQLTAAYPNQIRFIYRNLPLTQIHSQAMNAAEAALCAGDQDAYWQYHNQLFENYKVLNNDLYSRLAADLELDTTAFENCMTEHKYQADIEADMQFAIDLGIQSTPTFFINGIPVIGAQPLSVFQQVIDDELAGKTPQ